MVKRTSISTLSFYVYKNTLNLKIISSLKVLLSDSKMILSKRHKYAAIAMKNQKKNNKSTDKRIISNRLMNYSFEIII